MSSETSISVGRMLRQYREANGLTQAEVASNVGVTSTTVAKWEAGVNEITSTHANSLANTYGTTVSAFYAEAPAQAERLPPRDGFERKARELEARISREIRGRKAR